MKWEVQIKEGAYDPPRSVSELARCPYRQAHESYFLSKEDIEKIAAFAHIGSMLHRVFIVELKRDGVECRCLKEVETPHRFGLAARVDYLCQCGNETVVLELKTAKRALIDEHIRQIRIYMLLFQANKGLIVYVTKDPKPKIREIVEIDQGMSEDELLDLINKHALLEPIPGSYCSLCVVKSCKHHPQRARELL